MVDSKEKVSVLFVCMGNICRSPTAEGVFRKLVLDAELDQRVATDSAGTHAYHEGEPPDRRALAAAARRGIEMADLRARRVSSSDFERFDLILAMDKLNLVTLQDRGGENADRVRLLMDFSEMSRGGEVPDPYYGGTAGFERVLDLVENAAAGLLEEVRRRHL